MAWARLDDSFWCNEKVALCPDAALGLYVRAISYCAAQETDGRLTRAALQMLRAKQGRVQELVTAGLWDEDGDCYLVHDFLKYNPSAQEQEGKRRSKSIAGAIGAATRWHDGRNAPVPTRPVPDPVPTQGDPPLPPADAGGISPAQRAQRGSGRRRDLAALEAEVRAFWPDCERQNAYVSPCFAGGDKNHPCEPCRKRAIERNAMREAG